MTRSASLPPTKNRPPGPDRLEWGLVLLIVVTGLVLRCALPQRLAVEHFDEGIYASNLWFDAEQRFRYPARHLYAPPLVPWLLEWSQVFLGTTPVGTMIVGILSGTLTIGVLWWAVRSWFGVSAGLAAASLAAMSDYHLIYSRTALTEPVLCLLLLGSVYFLWLAVVELNFRVALVAGLCTGLAWCAKYNGWLPLAIGAAGLSAWAIFPKTTTPERGRRFLVFAVIALAALLVVSPVWWDLREDGGYRVVQENHARYLVGISGWGTAWNRQLENHRFLDGPLSWIGLLSAVGFSGVGGWLEQRKTSGPSKSSPRKWLWLCCAAGLMAVMGMWLGTSLILGVTGFAWLIAASPWWPGSRSEDDLPGHLAYWLIAAWFIGLFVTTPLYTPYPRLSLPWLMAAWITAAAMLGSPTGRQLFFGNHKWQSAPRGTAVLILLGLVCLIGLAGNVLSGGNRSSATWEGRTGLKQTAVEIQKLVQRKYQGQAVIYVYAEPALFFHLRANDLPMVAPVADLNFADQAGPWPTLLAVGPHAERSSDFQADFQRRSHQWEPLASFRYKPSELVLLDEFSPERIQDAEFQREQTIKLYRLKSP